MAGDSLYVQNGPTPPRIPLADIDNILVTDASTRKTPTWAIVLAVLLFPIGLLLLFVKETRTESRVTIYVRGSLGTPITVWSPYDDNRTQAEWYPVLAAIGR